MAQNERLKLLRAQLKLHRNFNDFKVFWFITAAMLLNSQVFTLIFSLSHETFNALISLDRKPDTTRPQGEKDEKAGKNKSMIKFYFKSFRIFILQHL